MYRWRTLRNAIRNANCTTQWIIEILNAHCAAAVNAGACLVECHFQTSKNITLLHTLLCAAAWLWDVGGNVQGLNSFLGLGTQRLLKLRIGTWSLISRRPFLSWWSYQTRTLLFTVCVCAPPCGKHLMVQDHAKNSDFEQIVCGQSSGIGQSKTLASNDRWH